MIVKFAHRLMRIGPRRSLESHGAVGLRLGGGNHLGDPRAGGWRIVLHDQRAYPPNGKGASGGLQSGRWASKGAAISKPRSAYFGQQARSFGGMDDRNNTIAGCVRFGGIEAIGLSIVTGLYFEPQQIGRA